MDGGFPPCSYSSCPSVTHVMLMCAPSVTRFREAVDVWLGEYNDGLRRVRHNTAALAWDMSVNTTRQSMQKLALFGQVRHSSKTH